MTEEHLRIDNLSVSIAGTQHFTQSLTK